jgi:hypothetical protein
MFCVCTFPLIQNLRLGKQKEKEKERTLMRREREKVCMKVQGGGLQKHDRGAMVRIKVGKDSLGSLLTFTNVNNSRVDDMRAGVHRCRRRASTYVVVSPAALEFVVWRNGSVFD